MPRPVIVINTYAGSLLVAAKEAGSYIVASLEDHGYGAGSQRLNFPGMTVIDEAPWPIWDGLRSAEVICLAHPPCACFSVQGANQAPRNRGINSDYFQCTKNAIEYALGLDVVALAVESVVPTMEGARIYHDEVAQRYGYNLYRILQNAVTFGIPQWRPRFWSIFTKLDQFVVHHRPLYLSVGEVLDGVPRGEDLHYVHRDFHKYSGLLAAKGLSMERVLDQGPGCLTNLIARFNGEGHVGMDRCHEIAREYKITTFSSAWPIQLDPGGFTHTLMRTSHWWYEGRPLTSTEYNVLAGFPPDYKFDKPREQPDYLSRGVAPPVATWILGEIERNLNGKLPEQQAYTDQVMKMNPGEIFDLRVKKAELKQKKLFNLDRKEG